VAADRRVTRSVSGSWRLLLDDSPHEGAWNMALDRAIQLEHAAGRSPATLRLYGWARPTVTLGRFQAIESVDVDECRAEGIGIARRFTGGRGVLHDDEVTYSVVAGLREGLPRGTTGSYRYLCQALVDAYRGLGVDADLTTRPRGSRSSGACYLHATHADVSFGALKLSGSAQVWYRETVLQHGSFVMTRDVPREARVFQLTPQEAAIFAESTAALADLIGSVPARTAVIEALASAFERLFAAKLEAGSISDEEHEEAARLVPETSVPASPEAAAGVSA